MLSIEVQYIFMVSRLYLQDTRSTYDHVQMPDMQIPLNFRKAKEMHKSHKVSDFALVSHLVLNIQLLQIETYC
jgi:hypothetical protein